MFSMILDSMKLFFAGRLFANYSEVFTRAILATVIGATVTVGVGLIAPTLLAAIAGGAVGGFMLPILFKNLKYR
ncbi:unnamed protein product [Laminaria digitata]|tara:strand:+ start:55534 stop:55755 length:222 start_codon:yes stop_codon:yes gene_type:complete